MLIAPGAVMSLYGVSSLDVAGASLARDVGALMVGVAVICWMVRNDAASRTRDAVTLGLAVINGVWAALTIVTGLRVGGWFVWAELPFFAVLSVLFLMAGRLAPAGTGSGSGRLDRHVAAARATLERMEPAEAHEAALRGALLVDIRPEFQRRRDGEVPDAIIVERNHLEWRLHPESPARIPEATGLDVRWIVLCDEGYASSLAAAGLRALGLRHATDVVGGLQAWRAAGLPVGSPGVVSTPRLAPRAPSAS